MILLLGGVAIQWVVVVRLTAVALSCVVLVGVDANVIHIVVVRHSARG